MDKFIAVTFLSSGLEDEGLLCVLCSPIQAKQKSFKLIATMKKLDVFAWNVYAGLLVTLQKLQCLSAPDPHFLEALFPHIPAHSINLHSLAGLWSYSN